MGKNNKKRKHALFHAVKSQHVESIAVAEDDDAVISESDLEITRRTIQKLTEQPELLQSKAAKEIRRLLHPLVLSQMQSYERIDYSIRVTNHLQAQKWGDALTALQACFDFQIHPKQGTVQRWVRDCDKVTDSSLKMKLLSTILRLSNSGTNTGTGGEQDCSNKHNAGQAVAQQVATASGDLVVLEGWKIPSTTNTDTKQREQDEAQELIPTLDDLQSQIIYREPPEERTPPNEYELLLHTVAPETIQWSSEPLVVVKHEVPFVPGAFVLDGVLTSRECDQLRAVATRLGFRPDHPVGMDHPTGIDSCEWLVDSSIRDVIYQRVQDLLPSQMAHNATRHSINPRWRFFRYAQDCVYRPHIDGSWPESRINANGEYECDESGRVKSYLTFLIYLADDFEGGETRYYFPSETGMMARGVIPKKGAVMVFPQANTASLIHEGSAVTKGTKYVVRTDVLFQTKDGV
eukprot:scaffold4955_cov204-Amphora_coffeaeformis.AAC.6